MYIRKRTIQIQTINYKQAVIPYVAEVSLASKPSPILGKVAI